MSTSEGRVTRSKSSVAQFIRQSLHESFGSANDSTESVEVTTSPTSTVSTISVTTSGATMTSPVVGGHPYGATFPVYSSTPSQAGLDSMTAEIRSMGIACGLSGPQLASFFVQEKSRREETLRTERMRREERQEQLRREERQEQLRREESVRQEQLRREELARQEQMRKEELQLRRAEMEQQERLRKDELKALVERVSADTSFINESRTGHSGGSSYKLKLDVCDDSTDIDTYLLHFERVVTANGWSREVWGSRLAPQLNGKARNAFIRLDPSTATDYETLKQALLEEYRRTPDFYRRQFRESRKQPDESFKQFLKRIEIFLQRWVDLSGCKKTYDEILDLVLKEQLMGTFSSDLASYVFEKKPKTAMKAAEIAFEHLEAKREAKLIQESSSSSTNGNRAAVSCT